MRKIVYTRPDGGLSVVSPIINTYPEPEKITEAEAEQRAWDRLPDDAINPVWVESVPDDRLFRNAWKTVAGAVVVDMEAAKELHRKELRKLRAPLLASADVEFIRALESGNTELQAKIAARKNSLRNVTADPAIESAQTPQELASIVPAVLRGEE